MSTCFGCEIQTVYSCLNRTKITENRLKKLKPNRTEKNLNRCSSISSPGYPKFCGALVIPQDVENLNNH